MFTILQIYIIGGYDASGNTVNSLEVFDSKTKQITKVIDSQNNWVEVPIKSMVFEGTQTCALPMIDKNAFILSGGRSINLQTNTLYLDVLMFHTDTR